MVQEPPVSTIIVNVKSRIKKAVKILASCTWTISLHKKHRQHGISKDEYPGIEVEKVKDSGAGDRASSGDTVYLPKWML